MRAFVVPSSDDCIAYLMTNDRGLVIAAFHIIKYQRHWEACGTWVNKKYRRLGLGYKLWRRALKDVKSIRVLAATKAGHIFIQSLVEKFGKHKVKWIS